MHFSRGKNVVAGEGSKEKADVCRLKAAECWEMFALKRCMKFLSKTKMNLLCCSCFRSEQVDWVMRQGGLTHPEAM